MKNRLLSLLLAAAVVPAVLAQNVTVQKTPAQPAGANANKLTDSSKVIVVGDGGSISATGTGVIAATSVSGGSISPTAPLTGGGPISGTVVIGIPKATSAVDGYLFHTDWATFNAKQAAGNYITALTGDATAAGPGSSAVTFATVNGNVGTFAGITVNAKGLVTGAVALTTLAGYGITDAVPSSRTVSATAPLTGGGALSGNLTLSIPAATSSVNGYLTSADWTTFNAKQTAGSYLTALTGDATASGPGSAAITFATVNSNVGTFGSATQTGTFTVNAKGLVTAAANVTVTPALASITGFGSGVASLLAGASSGTGGPAGTVAPTFTGTVTLATIAAPSTTSLSLSSGSGGASLTLAQGATGMPALVGNRSSNLATWFQATSAISTLGPSVLDVYEYNDSSHNPILGWGYNQTAGGTIINSLDAGFRWNLEGNYNDGSGQNKMETYLQYSSSNGSVLTRPIFVQMNKSTNGIQYVGLKGSVVFRADDLSGEAGTQRATIDGTNLFVSLGTDTTSAVTGSINTSGGIGITKSAWIGANATIDAGYLNLLGSQRAIPAYTTTGAVLKVAGAIVQDTTSSGTVANNAVSVFGRPNLLATNPTTYSDSSTLTIDNSPLANTNVTQTRAWALRVAAGNSSFEGDLYARSGSAATSTATGALRVTGGAGVTGDTYLGGLLNLGAAPNGAVAGINLNGPSDGSTVNQFFVGSSARGTMIQSSNSGGGNATMNFGFWSTGSSAFTNAFQIASFASAASNVVTIPGTLASTTPSTGALVIGGGAGVGGALNVGSTIDATTGAAGSLTSAGGIYAAKKLISNAATFDGTAAAISGINAITGGAASMTITAGTGNSRTLSLQSTTSGGTATTFLTGNADQSVTHAAGGTFAGTVSNSGTVDASSGSTGSFNTAGGLGVTKAVWVGTNVTIDSGALYLTGTQRSIAAYTTTGALLSVGAGIVQDTTSSGTVAVNAVSAFGRPNLIATSATTYTNSATLYVANSPLANTNVTQTNAWAFYVAAGRSAFLGSLEAKSGTGATSTTTGAVIITGGAGISGDAYIGANAWLGGATTGGNQAVEAFLNVGSSTAATINLLEFGNSARVGMIRAAQFSSAQAQWVFTYGASGPTYNDVFKILAASTNANASVQVLTDTEAVIAGTAAFTSAGGIYATKAIVSGSATDSSSITTGGIIGAGGLGITKAAFIGGLMNVAGVLTAANATDASNSTTAGTVISGGIAIAKKLYLGDDAHALGSVLIDTAGKTLSVKSGTNAAAGTVTLVGGAATITSTAIDANTVIVFSEKTAGGTPGVYQPLAAVASGSAAVTSAVTDTSTYNWVAVKVN